MELSVVFGIWRRAIKIQFNHVKDFLKKWRHAEINSKHVSYKTRDYEKVRKTVTVWEVRFWHPQSAVSLYLGNKQMESEREQMRGEMREGEGPGCCLPCREAYLPVVFFKKKFLSGSSYLAPARQLWQGNTLGLIWFVLVLLEMLQLWETGGWWSSRVTLILFLFQPFCALSLLFALLLPVSLSSLLLHCLFSSLMLPLPGEKSVWLFQGRHSFQNTTHPE